MTKQDAFNIVVWQAQRMTKIPTTDGYFVLRDSSGNNDLLGALFSDAEYHLELEGSFFSTIAGILGMNGLSAVNLLKEVDHLPCHKPYLWKKQLQDIAQSHSLTMPPWHPELGTLCNPSSM